MADLIFVRHGQANSLASDEESYDRLSDLGRSQAQWLGEHLTQTNPHFDRVLTGTLSRQVDTAKAMGYTSIQQDERLNELAYFALAQAALDEHGLAFPTSPAHYVEHLPRLMNLWSSNALEAVPERFSQFNARISDVIEEQCRAAGRALIVTSGGVIGVSVRHTLGLDTNGMAKIMLQIANSSMHRLQFIHQTLVLSCFNATPHLDTPDRAHARTHV